MLCDSCSQFDLLLLRVNKRQKKSFYKLDSFLFSVSWSFLASGGWKSEKKTILTPLGKSRVKYLEKTAGGASDRVIFVANP